MIRSIILLLLVVTAGPAWAGYIYGGLYYEPATTVLDPHSVVWWPESGRLEGRYHRRPARYQAGSRTMRLDGFFVNLPGPVLVIDGEPYLPRRLEVGDIQDATVWEPLVWPAPSDIDRPVTAVSQAVFPLKIYIDPGHGGEDSGAVGVGGVLEKDIVLGIARAAAEALRRRGYRVKMSRHEDVYPTLADRTNQAAKWGADLFVSIHCNWAPRRSASGVEVYVVGKISSDKQAERVARYENRFVEKMDDAPSGALGMILADLSQNDTAQRSLAAARKVYGKIQRVWGGEDRGVRMAPFWVLRNATMPSMLVEVGFISNPAEAERLARPAVQESYGKLLAQSIAEGASIVVKGVADVSR